MIPQHPFVWLPARGQWLALILSAITFFIVMGKLTSLGNQIKTRCAPPCDIISFELAGNIAESERIMKAWQDDGRAKAAESLKLDYLFIVAYVFFFGLGCVLVARAFSVSFQPFYWEGALLAWGQVVAGLLDAVEDLALLKLLSGSRSAFLPVLAQWCAGAKFALITLGLAYIVVGVILLIIVKVRRRPAD